MQSVRVRPKTSYADVAQLVECQASNLNVAGSNPVFRSRYKRSCLRVLIAAEISAARLVPLSVKGQGLRYS